jgi:hypothetical protein
MTKKIDNMGYDEGYVPPYLLLNIYLEAKYISKNN